MNLLLQVVLLMKTPKILLVYYSIFNVLLRSKNITDSFTDMPPTIISFSTNNDNKSIIQRTTNIKKSVCFLYEVGSLHKTKGATPNFISYYISSFFDTMKHTIYTAIHYRRPLPCTFTVSRSFIADHQKQFNRLYLPAAYQRSAAAYQRSASPYKTTLFSCPTRNRVFNIMSNPASSIFLQNATSSLHISTSSNPSFPRIR